MAPALLAASLVLAVAGSAHAYCRLTTEMPTPGDNCAQTGVGLTWRRSCISFSLAPRARDVPDFESIRDVTDISFAAWEAVGCETGEVGLEIGQTTGLGGCEDPEYNQMLPNANTIIFVSDWRERELPPDAFGLTLVWHNPDSGEIYDADMQLNENLGQFAICGALCPDGAVDLQNVITHEAGHFLGLGHSSDPNATMSARATVGETRKRDLSEDDRSGLCSIYGDDPAPMCSAQDYYPDNGFSADCWAGTDADGDPGLCSVGAGRNRAAPASLLVALAAALARLRRRRRNPAIDPA